MQKKNKPRYKTLKTASSPLGRKSTEETKLRISKAMLSLPRGDKHPLFGKILSEEVLGSPPPKNMSEAKLGLKHFGFGKALSEEHRAKIAASVLLQKNSPKISVLDLETNNQTIYNSMRDAAKALDCLVGSISYNIKKGNKNKPFKGIYIIKTI